MVSAELKKDKRTVEDIQAEIRAKKKMKLEQSENQTAAPWFILDTCVYSKFTIYYEATFVRPTNIHAHFSHFPRKREIKCEKLREKLAHFDLFLEGFCSKYPQFSVF